MLHHYVLKKYLGKLFAMCSGIVFAKGCAMRCEPQVLPNMIGLITSIQLESNLNRAKN